MQKFCLLVLICCYCFVAGPVLAAQAEPPTEAQAVMDKANDLNNLLDRLLDPSNNSSIQATIHEYGDSSDPLIAEAMRLKAQGEAYLESEDYINAATTLQAALDHVFKAIRSHHDQDDDRAKLQGQLSHATTANDTFMSTASRIVGGEPNDEAVGLLELAMGARARADQNASDGDEAAALRDMEESTDLAQQAIKSARDGKVIERNQ